MSASVVQHNSATGTGQTVSVTLNNPVTEGNLLAVVIGYFDDSIVSFSDGTYHGYNLEMSLDATGYIYDAVDVYDSTVEESADSLTLEVGFNRNSGTVKYVHIYEVSGVDTFDKQNGAQFTNSATPSAALGVNTSKANEFVLGVCLAAEHSDDTFSAGSGFTAGESTSDGEFSLFSEYEILSAVGDPTASCTITGGADTGTMGIMSWYLSSDSDGDSGGDSGGQ